MSKSNGLTNIISVVRRENQIALTQNNLNGKIETHSAVLLIKIKYPMKKKILKIRKDKVKEPITLLKKIRKENKSAYEIKLLLSLNYR